MNVSTNEILTFVVTDESVEDISCTDKLMDLVMAAGHDVGRLLADAGYDSKANWNRYLGMGMGVCINIRSALVNDKYRPTGRCRGRSRGCVARCNAIRRINKVGRDQWKAENSYEIEWKVECTIPISSACSWTY